jgi:tRNA pseudouridine13 synthase
MFFLLAVAPDGSLARLTSLDPTVKRNEQEMPPKMEEKNDTEAARIERGKRKRDDDVHIDWECVQTELKDFVDEPAAREVTVFLQKHSDTMNPSGSTDATKEDALSASTSEKSPLDALEKYIILPAVVDKEKRRNLHHWIKGKLSNVATAETMEGGRIRIWHQKFRSFMPNKFDNNKRYSGPKAPRDKPFLKFVLYKENMDTGMAIHEIEQKLSYGSSSRGARGSHRKGYGQRIRMGYAGNKDKRGVTAQFITVPSSVSVQRLCGVFNSHGGKGGGHTTGKGVALMKVGNFEFVSNELRLGDLQGNRFDVVLRNVQVEDMDQAKHTLENAAESIQKSGFINYFGLQRFGKFHDTHLTGLAILKGDYEGAIDIMMRPKDEERNEIKLAREKWQNRFKQMNGETIESIDARAKIEKECAAEILKDMNRFMQNERAILSSIVRNPLDYKKAFSNIARTMRMMFLHALQSYLWNKAASFRIKNLGPEVVVGDLVLVSSKNLSSGTDEPFPEVKVVELDDINANRYSMEDVVLPLLGTKTQFPKNESGKLFENILTEHNVTAIMISEMLAKDFNSAGDYRKLICRPTDVNFDIIEYSDELQPLLQTDFMKLNDIPVDGCSVEKVDKIRILAMIVGFSLPSSSYATIFLRELMKRPTSSEYQRDLKLGTQQ